MIGAEINAEDFVTVWNVITGDEDVMIRIRRTQEFFSTAREVSDFLKSLNLAKEENDHLVELMVKNVCAAEKGGFADGVRYGVAFATKFGKEQSGERQEDIIR